MTEKRATILPINNKNAVLRFSDTTNYLDVIEARRALGDLLVKEDQKVKNRDNQQTTYLLVGDFNKAKEILEQKGFEVPPIEKPMLPEKGATAPVVVPIAPAPTAESSPAPDEQVLSPAPAKQVEQKNLNNLPFKGIVPPTRRPEINSVAPKEEAIDRTPNKAQAAARKAVPEKLPVIDTTDNGPWNLPEAWPEPSQNHNFHAQKKLSGPFKK